MASTPIYNWPTPDNTGLVKNGALDMRTLGNAIDTTMATMTPKSTFTAKGSIAAATAASTPANLPVGANNTVLQADSTTATGLKYSTPAVVVGNIVTAKGDVIAATASGTVTNLAVGSNNQVLTADSTTATGLKWATPASGGGYTQLASGSLSGASLSLTSISQSYVDLVLYVMAWSANNDAFPILNINNNTAGTYNGGYTEAGDGTFTSTSPTVLTRLELHSAADLSAADARNNIAITIPNYTNTTGAKIIQWNASFINGAVTKNLAVSGVGFDYLNAAVTRIDLGLSSTNTFDGGTYILYGRK